MVQDSQKNYRQIGLLWLVIFAGMVLTFTATRETVRLSEEQATTKFETSAVLFARRVQEKMVAGLNAAQDVISYYSESDGISREIFLRLIKTNSTLNKNRRVVSSVIALRAEDEADFFDSIQRLYGGDISIREPVSPNQADMSKEGSRRFPLFFTWTDDQNLTKTLLGLNVGANKNMNTFLEIAISQSEPSAILISSFPGLDTDAKGQMLLANPFVSKLGYRGLILQLVDFPALIDGVREEMGFPKSQLQIVAISRWGQNGGEMTFSAEGTAPQEGRLTSYEQSFSLGGGSWTLTVMPSAGAFSVDYGASFVVASVCVLLTGLFFFIVWSQMRRARRVADIVNRRTRALKEAHDELEEHYKLLQNLNKDVEESRRSAELANRAKSEFLATMSHELRTPLNAILGFSQLLGEQALGPIGDRRYVEYSNDIHSSGSHLLSLINDILDLAKLEAGKINIEKNVISTRLLTERVVTLLSQQAESKGIEFAAEFGENMPDNILGDELRLRQILINLCTNAIKFTKTGSVTARLFSKPFKNGRQGWVLEVQDTGIGIPEEKQATLFDRFTQVDAALSRRHGGVGLGLAICRELVDRMEGRISVRSMPGVGTTVRVHLPLEEASSADMDNEMMI